MSGSDLRSWWLDSDRDPVKDTQYSDIEDKKNHRESTEKDHGYGKCGRGDISASRICMKALPGLVNFSPAIRCLSDFAIIKDYRKKI